MQMIMRYTASMLLLLLLGSACEKDLHQQPISSNTTETFFTTKNDFIQAANAVYSVALRGTTNGNSYGYPDRQLNLSETRSDNLYAVTDGARDWEGINGFFSTISNNTYVNEAYVNNYNAIGKANTLLENLQKNRAIVNDAALADRMEAEARFLRGFCYFDLVRWFGGVPIVDKTLSAPEALTIPRSPVADVYNFIIADLQYAAEHLPPSYTGADVGRATTWAAKGMLAQVHMARSGPTYGIQGPGLGLNEWNKAYALLEDIITQGPFSFLPQYSDIFSYNNENNAEVVFDVQYQSGGLGLGASFVWILTPDGYFNTLGLNNQGANYQRPVSTDFLSKFSKDDLRRQFSIKDGYTYQSTTATYSFYKKYIDASKYGTSRTDWPINYIVLGYTDLLMLKAECILHGGGGSQADADNIVNKVRARAGMPPVLNVTLPALMEERRREFCGEGKRWHDLVRSGLAESVMKAWIAADDVEHKIQAFNVNYILYPIPQSQMNLKAGLYDQNPGYD